ncbi:MULTISPECIES: Hsp20 family protein [unclassified Beijerinckia]|uniref:Hsp20 family protein n=1 Tax=unclassified Beijerinckia TaxID=2638183 RepID=UPI00089C9F2D|nr:MULTISPECIES: Hsp20 family protein [unclassified Beijerinckia]MDH7799280.1 molecular chaperone IbpA [Beijerinckia sp. GAS462]SED44691.1 molecular chaperone IbpA [Beijerinckia sp. 28-YEA-48]
MRHFDFSPLYRSTVGFDRLFSLLDQVNGAENVATYPPYNIERTGENAFRITVAVAGFSEADLSIETKENTLTIRGGREVSREASNENEADRNEVLYRGIAARSFERRFQLADHVHVQAASLANGLLHVDLVREIPESAKPRRIAIGTAQVAKAGPKLAA